MNRGITYNREINMFINTFVLIIKQELKY